MLFNILSGAKFLYKGENYEIATNGALTENVWDIDFLPGFNLEGYPTRDSTIYAQLYGIESAETILRGKLRYKVTFVILQQMF